MCTRRYESNAPQLPPLVDGNVDGADADVDDSVVGSVYVADADAVDGNVDGTDVVDCHRGVTSFSSSSVM